MIFTVLHIYQLSLRTTNYLYVILPPLLSTVHDLFQSASTQASVTLHWIPLSLNPSLLILLMLYRTRFGEIRCFVNRAIFILLKRVSRSVTIREGIFPHQSNFNNHIELVLHSRKQALKSNK